MVTNEPFVTTAAVDATSVAAQEEVDLSIQISVGEKVIERSSLFDSPFFQPSAISHQDFVMDYTDPIEFIVMVNLSQSHNPIG